MKPFYTNGKLAEQYFYETVKIFQNVYIFENYIGERNQVKEMWQKISDAVTNFPYDIIFEVGGVYAAITWKETQNLGTQPAYVFQRIQFAELNST